MKKLFLITLSTISMIAYGIPTWENKPTTTKPDWNFELRNKQTFPVELTVLEAGQPILSNAKIGAPTGTKEKDVQAIRGSGLDMTKNHTITVAGKTYRIPVSKAKKILVTFEKGKLRTQKGTLLGYTQSGISKSGNISNSDIK